MSAISNSRRILSGAALTAVFLGAGAGLAFAQDTDNSDNSDNSTTDSSTNVAANGGDQTSGDSTGGDGAAGGAGAASGDATGGAGDGDAVTGDGGAGGAGGDGGDGGDTGNTQNIAAGGNDASINTGSGAEAAGGSTSHSGTEAAHSGACDATCGVTVSKKSVPCPTVKSSNSSTTSTVSSEESASGDNTPVGAADTGDGVVLASNSSDLGGDLALAGGISAAALLGAYGVSMSRRRVGSHRGM